MLKTKEIRWFFGEQNHQLEKWFGRQGVAFGTQNQRTDVYLNAGQEDIGIKLREGNIEIKHRRPVPRGRKRFNNTCGYLEEWIKWSFDAKEFDDEFIGIIEHKKKQWIEVHKNR